MKEEKDHINEDPPILEKWKNLYFLVMLNLVGCLTLFYIIRRIFE